MNKLYMCLFMFLFLAMKPFWDVDNKSVIVQLHGEGHELCSTQNVLVFQKNSIIKCIVFDGLEPVLRELAAGRKKIKVIFATAGQKYVTPLVQIENQNYTLTDLIYYSNKKTLYAELRQGKKYYFYRVGLNQVKIEFK